MYEITCLGAETVGSDLEKIITDNQGKISQKQDLGQRRLAYKIKQQESAHYYCLNFTVAQDSLKKLSDQLRQAESIWRYLLVKGSYILAEKPLSKKPLAQPLTKPLTKLLPKPLKKKPSKKTKSLDDKLAEILKE